MFLEEYKIVKNQGKQWIPDLTNVTLPETFRGLPEISDEKVNVEEIIDFCPTKAIAVKQGKLTIDLGKCAFCGDCQKVFANKIKFTNDYKIASNVRENLIVRQGESSLIKIEASQIRKKIQGIFNRSLKLRQVCAGGDNGNELELGACGNVNFDMGRYGIEFTASPRHADGIVITGPITENMAEAVEIAYHAVPEPKIVVLVGTDAISGGIFAESAALKRDFLNKVPIDLYVPGNPIHPLTFINGVLELTRKKFRR